MRKIVLLLSILATALTAVLISCGPKKNAVAENQPLSKDSLLKRGEFLISISGCDDCHTPKKMGAHGPENDMSKRFGGYPGDRPLPPIDVSQIKSGWVLFGGEGLATVGPWGTSYAANISSDSTGIGTWTESQFKKALTEGKLKGLDGNRMLLPPMPWQGLKALSNNDVKAIFTFLMDSKPVKNVVPAPQALSKL